MEKCENCYEIMREIIKNREKTETYSWTVTRNGPDMISSAYSVSQNLDPFTGGTRGVQKCLEGSKTLLIAFLAFLDGVL